MFPLLPLCWVLFFFFLYHKWMLNFVKCYFCAYWVVHMIFTLLLCSLRILVCSFFCVVSLYGLDMGKAGLIKWSKFVWEGFKSRASVSWSQLALPDQSPSGDLPFQCRSPELGCLMWGLHPLLFREELHFCNTLSTSQHMGALARLSLSLSPVSTWLPLLFCGTPILLILVLRSYFNMNPLTIFWDFS